MLGIKVRTYGNVFASDVKWNHFDDFGETNTDRSRWRPEISVLNAFAGSQQNSNKTLVYDFPDGKDTGETIQTTLRSPGLDVTEVDSMTQRVTTIIEDKAKSAESAAKKAAKEKEILDRLAPKTEGDSAPSDQPSQ